jgi:hypothetical protein
MAFNMPGDHIPFCVVTFHNSDDECGSASDHATELGQIIQDVKHLTGKSQVNIVTQSKGGLNARVYLANIRTTNVANLIMIGTPNAGDVLANFDLTDPCKPAVFDLQVGASDTMATQNHNTNYYTIAGVCLLWPVPNDGLVPVYSVESLGYSASLGHTLHCYMSLLDRPEYNDALCFDWRMIANIDNQFQFTTTVPRFFPNVDRCHHTSHLHVDDVMVAVMSNFVS